MRSPGDKAARFHVPGEAEYLLISIPQDVQECDAAPQINSRILVFYGFEHRPIDRPVYGPFQRQYQAAQGLQHELGKPAGDGIVVGLFQFPDKEDRAGSLKKGRGTTEILYGEANLRRYTHVRDRFFLERPQVFRDSARNQHGKQERRFKFGRRPFRDIRRFLRGRKGLANYVALIKQQHELPTAEKSKQAYKYPVPPGGGKSVQSARSKFGKGRIARRPQKLFPRFRVRRRQRRGR